MTHSRVAVDAAECGNQVAPGRDDAALIADLGALLGPADIQDNDPRFGPMIHSFTEQSTLKKALTTLREGAVVREVGVNPWPELRNRLLGLYRRLAQLHSASIEEDLHSLLLALTGSERSAELVARRLGWADGEPHTLREVGDAVGVTHERVRQIESRTLQTLAGRSVYAPQLRRAVECAQAMAPCTGADLARTLVIAYLAHHHWRASTLVSAARLLGVTHDLRVMNARGGECLAREVATSELIDRVHRLSRDAASTQGAANVRDIASRLSEELQRWVSEREICAVIRTMSDVKWIDESNGWYWLSDDGNTYICNTLRKMLSVAQRLSIDELYEGMLKSYRMSDAVFAPRVVILKLCAQIPWLRLHNTSQIAAREPQSWQDVLSGVERTVVEELTNAGNILDRHDLRLRCKERGVPLGSFSAYEQHSPLLRRIVRGVWGLRGVDFDPELLVQLTAKMPVQRARTVHEASVRRLARSLPGSVPGTHYLYLRHVKTQALKHQAITLSRLAPAEPGTRFSVCMEGKELGEVVLTEEHQLRGLQPLLKIAGTAAIEGRVYAARFDLSAHSLLFESVERPVRS